MSGARDVAIYSPGSNAFYEDPAAGPRSGPRGGGRELQMALLARSLAAAGLDVAHIVWPLGPREPTQGPAPALVERGPYEGDRPGGRLREARQIWGAMRRADARAYVFRGGGPQLAVAALFCRLHRRHLVFSAAIDLDFDLERPDRGRSHLAPYAWALRRADAIVVQSEQQGRLAAGLGLGPVTLIPSFAEPVESAERDAEPRAFLWIGRLVSYKRPLAYLELARAVPEASFRMIYQLEPEQPADRELADRLPELAAELPNLELLGQLPRARTLAEIGSATAVVSTSAAEGMPNVFLEAWARGVPVLSLDYDPDGRIAAEGLGISAAGSPEAFAEGARRLWAERPLRDRLGAAGRAYVERTHSPAAVTRRWVDLLRDLEG